MIFAVETSCTKSWALSSTLTTTSPSSCTTCKNKFNITGICIFVHRILNVTVWNIIKKHSKANIIICNLKKTMQTSRTKKDCHDGTRVKMLKQSLQHHFSIFLLKKSLHYLFLSVSPTDKIPSAHPSKSKPFRKQASKNKQTKKLGQKENLRTQEI